MTPTVRRRVTDALRVLLLVAVAAVMLSWIGDFLWRILPVFIIVIGALFFTYAIYPIVRRLNKRLPLVWSLVLVYAAIAAVAALGVSTVAPALSWEIQQVVQSTPDAVKNSQHVLLDRQTPFFGHLPSHVRLFLSTIPLQLAALAQKYSADVATQMLAIALSFVGLLATVIVIPVMSAYMMFEGTDILEACMRLIPPSRRDKAIAILHDLDAVLGGFIRGQLLVGLTIGVCITVALFILHVKYALLIGVIAGVLDVIPYVGAIAGFIPAVTLAFLNGGWQHAVIVALVFAGIFQAEGHFIAPRIVSDSVGLSPLMVIIAILIGGETLGIFGMFIAVPIAAVLRVLVLHALPAARRPIPAAQAAELARVGEPASEDEALRTIA